MLKLQNFNLSKGLFWLTTVTGGFTLVLVIVSLIIQTGNQELAKEVSNRNATINQNVALSNLNQSLVTALGRAVVEKNDQQIKALLTNNGITVTPREDGASAQGQGAPANQGAAPANQTR